MIHRSRTDAVPRWREQLHHLAIFALIVAIILIAGWVAPVGQ
jgi:hypothetical protein